MDNVSSVLRPGHLFLHAPLVEGIPPAFKRFLSRRNAASRSPAPPCFTFVSNPIHLSVSMSQKSENEGAFETKKLGFFILFQFCFNQGWILVVFCMFRWAITESQLFVCLRNSPPVKSFENGFYPLITGRSQVYFGLKPQHCRKSCPRYFFMPQKHLPP